MESAVLTLQMQRNEADILAGKTISKPISKDEQYKITAELLQVLMEEGFYLPEYNMSRVQAKIAECFGGDSLLGLLDLRESFDRQQFLVSKAIMAYLEQLVKESRQRAGQRFKVSTSKSEKSCWENASQMKHSLRAITHRSISKKRWVFLMPFFWL